MVVRVGIFWNFKHHLACDKRPLLKVLLAHTSTGKPYHLHEQRERNWASQASQSTPSRETRDGRPPGATGAAHPRRYRIAG